MLTLQKKIKINIYAAFLMSAFGVSQPLHAVVEKPNYKPFLYLMGAGIATTVIGTILNPERLQDLLEEKAIDAWIGRNNLNQFGEPKETLYYDKVNGPLENGQSRISYIKAKLRAEDDESWKNGFVRMLDIVKNLKSNAIILSCGGMSLALISFVFMLVLDARYTNARWEERIAQWKTEGIELEKKLVTDISAAVLAGMSAPVASGN